MVSTQPVDDFKDFWDHLSGLEANTLDERGARDLYDIYMEVAGSSVTDNRLLVVVPEWLSLSKIDRRRPYFLGSVEYDDDSKAAVLFSNLETINVSIVENHALEEYVDLGADYDKGETLEAVDISDENEYVDSEGMLWIPRTEMAVFEI